MSVCFAWFIFKSMLKIKTKCEKKNYWKRKMILHTFGNTKKHILKKQGSVGVNCTGNIQNSR